MLEIFLLIASRFYLLLNIKCAVIILIFIHKLLMPALLVSHLRRCEIAIYFVLFPIAYEN